MVRRSSPGTKPSTAKEAAHAAGVRVEQMQSDIKGILEAVTGLGQELRGEMQALGAKLSGKIEDLEDVVRTNSADIKALRAEFTGLRHDFTGLRHDFTGLRHDFDHREERGRVSALEDRVSAIETQLSTASR
jgi:hypothetical protein